MLRASLTALTAASLMIAIPTTAQAKSVKVPDGKNSPATSDITSATYRNSEYSAGVVVHVRDLRRSGKLTLRMGPPDSDVWYEASVRVKAGGSLATRMTYSTDTSNNAVRCSLRAHWRAAKNTVSVSAPQSCLHLGFLTKMAMSSVFRAHGHTDVSGVSNHTWRSVGRGDSPRCVTKHEFGAAKLGMTQSHVHAMWDTAGHYRLRQADTINRGYKACNVAGTHVYAEFTKHKNGKWYLTWKKSIVQ